MALGVAHLALWFAHLRAYDLSSLAPWLSATALLLHPDTLSVAQKAFVSLFTVAGVYLGTLGYVLLRYLRSPLSR